MPNLPIFSCKASDHKGLKGSPLSTFSGTRCDVPETLISCSFQKYLGLGARAACRTLYQMLRCSKQTRHGPVMPQPSETTNRCLTWGVAITVHENDLFSVDGASGKAASLRNG